MSDPNNYDSVSLTSCIIKFLKPRFLTIYVAILQLIIFCVTHNLDFEKDVIFCFRKVYMNGLRYWMKIHHWMFNTLISTKHLMV